MHVRKTMTTGLGPIHLVATDEALVAALFEGQDHPLVSAGRPVDGHPVLERAARELTEYFAGARRDFDVPLAPAGTPFQQRVWQALLAIPCGSTTSYGELARQLGEPTAARAVGAAVGKNPIAVMVPCHRVVGAQGQLTGYAGGLHRKRDLLALERGGELAL